MSETYVIWKSWESLAIIPLRIIPSEIVSHADEPWGSWPEASK